MLIVVCFLYCCDFKVFALCRFGLVGYFGLVCLGFVVMDLVVLGIICIMLIVMIV